jgi:hypothetical protein
MPRIDMYLATIKAASAGSWDGGLDPELAQERFWGWNMSWDGCWNTSWNKAQPELGLELALALALA